LKKVLGVFFSKKFTYFGKKSKKGLLCLKTEYFYIKRFKKGYLCLKTECFEEILSGPFHGFSKPKKRHILVGTFFGESLGSFLFKKIYLFWKKV
jgi:hypothetical protein